MAKQSDGHTISPKYPPESKRRRAIGLARLLTYALADAEEIQAVRCADAIREAITDLRVYYSLTDRELFQDVELDIH